MAVIARDDNGDVPFGWVDDDGYTVPWWASNTGHIVKWAIVVAIFASILIFVVGGYFHAHARLKKGLQPLAYHRWLVRKYVDPVPRPEQGGGGGGWMHQGGAPPPPPQDAYYMNNMPPPPVYDPTRPPAYSGPPEGGSKIDPSQFSSEPTHRPAEANPAPDYEALSGPPPVMR